MPAGRPSDYDPAFCEQLIEHMSKGFSFEAFGGVIGVARATLYNWEEAHPEFLDAKRIGQSRSQHFWEGKGIDGLDQGKNFNATTWIFAMKNRFNWTDRVDQTITADVNNKHSGTIDLKAAKDDELMAFINNETGEGE